MKKQKYSCVTGHRKEVTLQQLTIYSMQYGDGSSRRVINAKL